MSACAYNCFYLYTTPIYTLLVGIYNQRYYIILYDELKFSICHDEFFNELPHRQRFVRCKNKIAFCKRREHISSLCVGT